MLLKNPAKKLWPKITKKELFEYYQEIADLILPFLKNRPITVNRCPNGIKKECWIQKDFSDFKNLPGFVHLWPSFSFSAKRHLLYCLVQNKETLLWLVNLASIEFHIWFSTITQPDKPDWLIFDLDIGEKATFSDIKDVAFILKDEIFKKWRLKSWVKTTGKTGLHVLIPVRPQKTYKTVRQILKKFILELDQKYPDKIAVEARIKKRAGKVYLDYAQNAKGKLMIAPYSARVFKKFTISLPLSWKELKKFEYSYFEHPKQVLAFLKRRKDPWEDLRRQNY